MARENVIESPTPLVTEKIGKSCTNRGKLPAFHYDSRCLFLAIDDATPTDIITQVV